MKKILLPLLIATSPLWSAPATKAPDTNLPKVTTLIPQLLPRNPINKPPPGAVQKQLEAFFAGIQSGKVDESFKALVANNPALSDPAAVPEFVGNIRKGLEVFGPIQGQELYDNRSVGSRILYITYISFHPKKPLRWQFVYYSPVGADWKLLNLRFDDTIEHEAHNPTDELRAVLILDAWNPFIAADERPLITRWVNELDAHGRGLAGFSAA